MRWARTTAVSCTSMTELGTTLPVTLPVLPATHAVCPYLLAADGGWRASTPAREHRCTAVVPGAILATDKQRRLCLVAEHQGCSTFAAASGIGGPGDQPVGRRRAGRPVARTAPLVLDHGRVSVSMPALRPEHLGGQGGLVALMAVAFLALVVARFTGGGPSLTPTDLAGVGGASPTAAAEPATDGPEPTAGATPDGVPSRTLVPTENEPTPPPDSTTPPDPTSEPSGTPDTYTVRSGDTLSGIAGVFGTTWQVLAELNGIEDPARLRVGQVLDLP